MPLTWPEFKTFLRKNLGDFRAFIDSIKSRAGLPVSTGRSPRLGFDADGGPEESDLIRFFREGLKPSIKAQMEQRGPEINSWDELVEKVIEAVRSWLVSTGHSGYHRICQLL